MVLSLSIKLLKEKTPGIAKSKTNHSLLPELNLTFELVALHKIYTAVVSSFMPRSFLPLLPLTPMSSFLLLPFLSRVFFHTSKTPGFIIGSNITPYSCVHKQTLSSQTCIPSGRCLAHILFPNQKQTAINRPPCLLSHTGESLNQSGLRLMLSQVYSSFFS